MKNKIVFSTNRDFKPDIDEVEQPETPEPGEQILYISLQRLKGGKIATVVENFVGAQNDLDTLGKTLKTKCGVGGTVKDGLIHIQGEQRDKIVQLLISMGYKVKKKGG